MKVCKSLLSVAVVAGPLFMMAVASGCDSQQEIPLAKVGTPPPLPVQDKSKLKTPKGASPSVLPQ